MEKIVNYFGGEKRFYIIMIVLIIMWLGMIVFFYLKADEVTKNPCQICAKKIGDNVDCSVGNQGRIMKRIYYPNFTINNYMEGEANALP